MTTIVNAEPQTFASRASSPLLDVSVVIPCLNEANSLAFCIDKATAAFRTAGLRGEVVVADNGSTDGSIAIAEEHGARVVPVSERGYGAALRAGIASAHGEFIIMGDADDSYDFTEVPNFVAKLREGYDLVMGNRFSGGIKPGAMPPLHKYFGNPGLTFLLNTLFRSGVGDVYCGLRGFTRALAERLDVRSTGMEFALEMVIKAVQMKARVAEIPIILWPDKRGRAPHLRSFRDGWRSLRFMLLYAPNWLFLLPGASLGALGLAMVFWLLPGPRQVGGIHLDIHTMIFGVFFTLLGRADSFDRSVREGFQLCGAIRSWRGVAEARVAQRDARIGAGPWRSDVFGGFCGLRLDYLELGLRRLRGTPSSAANSVLGDVAVLGRAGDLRFVLPQYAGYQPRDVYRRLRTKINGHA